MSESLTFSGTASTKSLPSSSHSERPILALVIPTYNEEEMLPITLPALDKKLRSLIQSGVISPESFALYVNDGSKDETWRMLAEAAAKDPDHIGAISLSHNRGHQLALLAGLLHVKDHVDMAISLDADLQDDIDAIDRMILAYQDGYDVVCGVRDDRTKDTRFKRNSAQLYYRILKTVGVEAEYNHADYRLMSQAVLQSLSNYDEVNLFLRGLIPHVGYKTAIVTYQRHERVAGESKYPLRKMLKLAWDGVTSFSVAPLRVVTVMGALVFIASIIMGIYIVVRFATGQTVTGWASLTLSIWAIGGLLLLALGVIGEYIGKIYMESKRRPRYHVISAVGKGDLNRHREGDRS